jgi:hypothetical protein
VITDRCIVASWIDADERYGAYIYTPAGAYVAESHSLKHLAETCEATARSAIEGLGRRFDRSMIEHKWLGLLADTSPAHVGELMVAYAEG